MHGTFWGGEAYLLVLDNSERRLRWEGTWKGMKAVRSFEFMDAGDGMVSLFTTYACLHCLKENVRRFADVIKIDEIHAV